MSSKKKTNLKNSYFFFQNLSKLFVSKKFDKLKLKKINLVLTNILKMNTISLNNFQGIQIHD